MTEEKNDALAKKPVAAKEIAVGKAGVVLATVQDAMNYADWNQQSGLLPDHIDNPKKAFAIMTRGAEMGLGPHASWRWIYMTKAGKMSMETKGMLAVCQASPHFAGYKEWIEHEDGPEEEWVATAVAKRKGFDDQLKTFSFKDAAVAGLTGQKTNRRGEKYDTTYCLYLKDMLLARARARALELQFADVLGGIAAKEIQQEVESRGDRGQIRPEAPEVTVSDPLLDELSPKAPEKDPATQEVIDAQVEEIFDAKDLGVVVVGTGLEEEPEPEGIPEGHHVRDTPDGPETAKNEPRGPTIWECECGKTLHVDRKACPACGLQRGEKPPGGAPPSEKEENPFERGKRKAREMKKGQQSLPKE